MPLSRFRLPVDVRPTDYDLHLEPDLERGTFRGEVRIAVRLTEPRRAIVLHAAELAIDHAAARVELREVPARVSLHRADETVRLRFARPLPAGDATLVLGFRGALNQHLRGLYGVTAEGRKYAFTQCEAADARRILPCFDEPSFKARFRVAVTVREGETAIGNGAVEREAPAPGGRIVYFAPTPPLSTYLLALAVGPLEASAVRVQGGTPIRIWHVPGKGAMTELGLEAAAAALARLEDYFGIPYPYGKLDLVAVPDFEAGAMENAGAVFFRETLLLLDPATASLAERKRAAEVIAHELAHMWYGDLVTMAWWDDLWLNEAFATWMAYKVVDDWRPEWRLWQAFEHDRASALSLDALANTHPIYAEVRSVAEATENFDAITYEKGAAVVRMIEQYLGSDEFRAGVRLYMRRHREGNTVAADLWRALEEASGREVTRVARAWIERAGFPLVTMGPARGAASGTLRVRQERFFADPRLPAPRRRGSWPLPLLVRWRDGGEQGVERFLVDRATTTITIPRAGDGMRWYFGNANAAGFYRVRHDTADRVALTAYLEELTAVERLAFVGDQWALVRAGRAAIETFLDVANALAEESDYDVIDGVAAALARIDEQVAPPGSRVHAELRSWMAETFGPALARLGWQAAPGEPDEVRLRRAALLRLVGGVAEAPAVMAEARRLLDVYLRERTALEPNLADAVVALAARGGDDVLYERYRGIVAEARTPQERRRFLLNLGSFRTPAAVRRTLDAVLTPEIPTQDVTFVLMRLLGNPPVGPQAWAFLKKNWRAIRHRVPPLMLSRLVEATPALREPRYAREVGRFFRTHPVPEATRALKQALEVFRLNAELRRRTGPGLAGWLARRAA
ncbi:MAG TPA: M1 family metallopeptidase [Candidatus Binatia bacterium]|jgi:puromycin-sensitive aminopeptidase|nr:M1 family metallopeptidase [Candidatus Binatia bacterium]